MDLASLHAAYRRIAPHTHRTPLLTSRLLDELLGKRVFLKAEHLQKTGSFKARGALAKALTLESPKGLLAVSSGNHAQGVAYAARVLGVRALLVIPEEASPLKKAAARAYGAEVVDRGVPPSPPPRRARGRPPRPSAWRIRVGFTYEGKPVYAEDLGAVGAMAALLKQAFLPNLVQTAEGNPAFVHMGPFGNIAHGTNSVRASRFALGLADYVVQEAGFATDLGLEKFMNVVART